MGLITAANLHHLFSFLSVRLSAFAGNIRHDRPEPDRGEKRLNDPRIEEQF